MTLRLKILPRAENDAQSILDYISKRSPQGASAWWAAFEDATSRVLKESRAFGLGVESSAGVGVGIGECG